MRSCRSTWALSSPLVSWLSLKSQSKPPQKSHKAPSKMIHLMTSKKILLSPSSSPWWAMKTLTAQIMRPIRILILNISAALVIHMTTCLLVTQIYTKLLNPRSIWPTLKRQTLLRKADWAVRTWQAVAVKLWVRKVVLTVERCTQRKDHHHPIISLISMLELLMIKAGSLLMIIISPRTSSTFRSKRQRREMLIIIMDHMLQLISQIRNKFPQTRLRSKSSPSQYCSWESKSMKLSSREWVRILKKTRRSIYCRKITLKVMRVLPRILKALTIFPPIWMMVVA